MSVCANLKNISALTRYAVTLWYSEPIIPLYGICQDKCIMGRALPSSKDICELEIKVCCYHNILYGVCFPTPKSLLNVSRHPSQDMCAINDTNTVLKTN